MKQTLIPTLLGVFSSLLCIWLIHSFFVVDDCLDHGGSFDYKTNQCLLANGQYYEGSFSSVALFIYVIVGFLVSLTVARVLRAIFTMNNS